MQPYKAECIEFMVRCEALRFGRFTTKSGRLSPYFMNAGRFDSGARLARLGEFYAQAIIDNMADRFDLLFGPAYKGIPLVSAASIALARLGRDVPFAFNRKEVKDHGEGGGLIGRAPKDGDRVVIVEDVTTAGTSVRETAALLSTIANVKLAGLVVLVDRQEKGPGGKGALTELKEEFGIEAFAIVTLDEIVEHLHNRPIDGKVMLDDAIFNEIAAYRAQYGA